MWRLKLYFLGLIALLCLTWSCTPSSTRNIPIADFLTNTEKSNFRISPNGRYVTYLEVNNQQRTIFLIDMQAEEILAEELSPNIQDVGNYFWISEEELIFTERIPDDDSLRLYGMHLGETPRLLLPPASQKIRFIHPVVAKNNSILISMNAKDGNNFDVYRLPLDGTAKTLVAENPGNIIRWYPDLDGELRMALASDSIQETVVFRPTENDTFKPVLQNVFHTTVVPLGFVNGQKNHVYSLSNVDRDKLSLVELDMVTGQEVDVLFSHEDVDLSPGGFDVETGTMRYAYFIDSRRARHFLDQDYGSVYQSLQKQLPDSEFRVLDEDFTDHKMIVHAFTDTNPGIIYFYDGDADKLVPLSVINPKLDNVLLSEMTPVSYEARDGRTIQGYLTLPRGGNSKGLPVIVYPHGGPSERNIWGYNTDVQFFANRGYAVFQVNYRGSSGYGKEFWTSGFKEWGGTIQDDITDGVQWLIDEKIADPKRIGIFGLGFGGYSALHGAAFNSDLYAAAASYGGFTNLFTHLKEIPPHLKPYLQKYYEIIGNPETESSRIRAMSPVFHAEKIEIPVFIAQGGKDSRSSVPDINQFVQKIRKRNVPVTFILKEDEGRYFRKDENRALLYEELGLFFDTHLKRR